MSPWTESASQSYAQRRLVLCLWYGVGRLVAGVFVLLAWLLWGRKRIFKEPCATLIVRGSFPGRPLSPELQLWVTSAKQLCLVMVKLMSKASSQMQVVTKSPTQICVHFACLTSS